MKGILFTLQISKKMFGNGPTFKEKNKYIFNVIWCNKCELKLDIETYIEFFFG